MSVVAQIGAALPPRKGAVVNLTLDATARPYDITTLPLGGFTPDAAANRDVRVVLRLEAVTVACYLYFNPTTDATLDDAATLAVGGSFAAAFTTGTHAAIIPAGTYKDFIINRAVDKFLIVKGSGAGLLRIHAASEALA